VATVYAKRITMHVSTNATILMIITSAHYNLSFLYYIKLYPRTKEYHVTAL
ncbi:unnamed protein product, partial [Heterobilharzia americana]